MGAYDLLTSLVVVASVSIRLSLILKKGQEGEAGTQMDGMLSKGLPLK